MCAITPSAVTCSSFLPLPRNSLPSSPSRTTWPVSCVALIARHALRSAGCAVVLPHDVPLNSSVYRHRLRHTAAVRLIAPGVLLSADSFRDTSLSWQSFIPPDNTRCHTQDNSSASAHTPTIRAPYPHAVASDCPYSTTLYIAGMRRS